MSNSESSQELKIGDVVKLKSGGPKMTVVLFNVGIKRFECLWFAGEHFDKVESYYFPSDSLQLIVE